MRQHRSTFLPTVWVCLLALYAVPAAAQPTELFFSEYIEGTSNNKALEIYNGTGQAVSLSGYSIQIFFNGSPAAGLTINLSGTVAAGGVFVVTHASADPAILAKANLTNGSGWFNGDDAVVLRKDLVVIDSIGQIGFDPGTEWGAGLASTADNTLRRKNTITAGDANAADAFDPAIEWDGFATNTFGGLGGGIVVTPPLTTRTIAEIQGSGAASPFAGSPVKTLDNVVTALTADGFFIQAPVALADTSDQTSDGIFVFTGSAPTVAVGDQVDVTGTVTEFFGMTELTSVTVTVDSGNNALPPAFLFGEIAPSVFVPSPDQPWPANELERFEGMLVRVENGTVTAPTDRFGDTPIVAHGTRAFREPGMEYPGQGGYSPLWDGNPEIFDLKADGAGLAAPPLAAGTVITVAEGPLAFAFSDYQLWPTTLTYAQPQLPRPVRARNAGELTVGSQNLLRFFDADRSNGPDDGAANAAKFPAKLVKASLHIRTVLGAPDVLVVEEVENLGVVQALAAQVAADDPSLVYSAHLLEGNDMGGIDTGFLVRNTVAVSSVTQLNPGLIFNFPGSQPDELHDRPPLVLTGAYTANGAPFPITVIGIHNRSLSNIETSARVRQKRLEQANDIAAYVQSIQLAEPDRRIVLMGDFNAFPFSDGFVDAIGIITGNLDANGALLAGQDMVDPNLVDQVSSLPAAEQYSYIFESSAQVLDHTLTTANLTPFVRGLQFARGNADAPETFRDDPSTPLALSDHDAEVLFVMTDFDADALPDDVDSCPSSITSFVTVGACTTTVPEQVSANGCSLSDALASMAAASGNHGLFVSQATHWLNQLRASGAIDNRQRSDIHRCVAAANSPQ